MLSNLIYNTFILPSSLQTQTINNEKQNSKKVFFQKFFSKKIYFHLKIMTKNCF